MCDPITLIGAAATIGSVGANYVANQQAQNARNDAMAAERIRQRQLDQEAAGLNNQSRDRYENFGDQQGERAGKLKEYYADVGNRITAPLPTEAPIGSKASGVVAQEMAKQGAKADAFADQQNTALAGKNAFGSLFGDISRLQARDAGLVGQLAGFKKGSAGILPLELEAAAQKGAGLKLAGDILGGLGSIGVKAGLGGAGAGGLSSLFGGGGVGGVDFGVVPFNPAGDDWISAGTSPKNWAQWGF